MGASYSISSVGSDKVKISIVPDSGYSYYRVFVRLSSDTSDSTIDHVFTITTTSNITLNGLEPETDYTINVGYSNTDTTDRVVGWIGAKTFTTEAEELYYYVKITYNANGGTGEPDAEQFSDTDEAITVTISSTIPTREGYTFLGWSFDRTATSADWLASGVYYNWKGSTGVTKVTLYAVWARNAICGGVWINGQYYIPWIYSNGWQKYAAHVYSNGWKTTKDG